jgi:hypothetical protein
MTTHEFTLVLGGVDVTDAVADALYGAIEDGSLGTRAGVPYMTFHREAESPEQAILSAIADVNNAGVGLTVIRVEPDDMVSASEIAKRIGKTRETVRLYANGERGPGGFPAPVSGTTSRMPLYRWSEVAAWLSRLPKGKGEDAPGPAAFALDANAMATLVQIGAVNAALELQRFAGAKEGMKLLKLIRPSIPPRTPASVKVTDRPETTAPIIPRANAPAAEGIVPPPGRPNRPRSTMPDLGGLGQVKTSKTRHRKPTIPKSKHSHGSGPKD